MIPEEGEGAGVNAYFGKGRLSGRKIGGLTH
jgi:hypothetical protein